MAASLDKSIAEVTTHHHGVKAELDAMNEYLEGLNKKCTYTVESYEERKARHEELIAVVSRLNSTQ